MERPAHTALFQSIWNLPAEENGQNVYLGSWGGGVLLLWSAFAFATFGCSLNLCAGELPHSASSHFVVNKYTILSKIKLIVSTLCMFRQPPLQSGATQPPHPGMSSCFFLPFFPFPLQLPSWSSSSSDLSVGGRVVISLDPSHFGELDLLLSVPPPSQE